MKPGWRGSATYLDIDILLTPEQAAAVVNPVTQKRINTLLDTVEYAELNIVKEPHGYVKVFGQVAATPAGLAFNHELIKLLSEVDQPKEYPMTESQPRIAIPEGF